MTDKDKSLFGDDFHINKIDRQNDSYISLKDFGASGNGIKDDTATIQKAIDFASANKKSLSLVKGNYLIKGKLYVKSDVKLFDGTFTFGLAGTQVVITGNNIKLEDILIASGTYGTQGTGIIELVNTINFKIKNVEITADNQARALQCKTKAFNTNIDNFKVSGTAWGILFNDAESEQGAGYRTFDGVSYSGVLGEGLIVRRYEFYGNINPVRAGDALEINCPDNGFKKIVVEKCIVDKTNTTTGNGIGLGFANCQNVLVDGCKLSNIAFNAIHFEKGSNHKIVNCHIEKCWRAFSILSNTDYKVINNTVINSLRWIESYSTITANDILVSGNTFDGNNYYSDWTGTTVYAIDSYVLSPINGKVYKATVAGTSSSTAPSHVSGTAVDGTVTWQYMDTAFGALFTNAKYLRVTNNTFKNYKGDLTTHILQYYDIGNGGINYSTVKQNYFIIANGNATTNVCGINANCANNEVSGNVLDGYQTFYIRIFDPTVNRQINYTRGLPTNYYIESNGTPEGYFAGGGGGLCLDVTNGTFYRKTTPGNSAFGWVKITPSYLDKGIITYSGDGTTNFKTFAHNFGWTPTAINITAGSLDCGNAIIKYVTADTTNITVFFNTAPVSGTNNVTFRWRAEY